MPSGAEDGPARIHGEALVIDLRRITIISGGQTGADRAALDFAIEQGIARGGWCPRGRRAEDGPLPPHYDLHETPSRDYSQRTEWNVRDSDATAAFTIGPSATGGTLLALESARRLDKPRLHLARDLAGQAPLSPAEHASRLLAFLAQHDVTRLNIAGPRASQEPDVYQFVRSVLDAALRTGVAASTP
jgi:hypothetical protein